MEREPYLKENLYRRDINDSFKAAFTDKIISPLFQRMADGDRGNPANGIIILDGEQVTKAGRTVYEFDADFQARSANLSSTTYQAADRDFLTAEAAEQIHREIQAATPEHIRYYAQIDFFTRHMLTVIPETDTVTIRTYNGYCVNGREIKEQLEPNELDSEFEKTYDVDELLEILRPLFHLNLISELEIKAFLDEKF